MNYILKDIFDRLKKSLNTYSSRPIAFEDKGLTQISFWKFIFDAAEQTDLNPSPSQVSRWTKGECDFQADLLNSLADHYKAIQTAFKSLIDELSKSDKKIYADLESIFKTHKIYFLLNIDENNKQDDIPYIIYSIITGQKTITARSKLLPENNPCFRNLPYATTYDRILPIDIVQTFFREAFSKYRYVIIWGIPGLGKLSQAVYYIMHNTPTHYYCLNFEDSIENTFLHYNFEKATVTPKRKYRLSTQFSNLKKKENTILIINNVGTDIQNDPAFSKLIQLPIRIIFLSSCYHPVSINTLSMPHLTHEQCIEFFYQNCPRLASSEENDKILSDIISTIEYHTLSLELISKLVQNGMYSLEDIAYQINKTPLIDSKTALLHQEKDGSNIKRTYKDFILNLFDIEHINETYKEVLFCVSLLPRNGYNRISFNRLINDSDSNQINDLINLGWIQLNERLNTISLHPLIQSCFLQQLEPTPTLCLPFLHEYVESTDWEDYDNETEIIWLGLSILKYLHENSQQWFEISYMIITFLRKQWVDSSIIKKLLDNFSHITVNDTIDQLNGFYIRHVNNMYQLYDAPSTHLYPDAVESMYPDVFNLTDDILSFCEGLNTMPSYVLMDMLIAQQQNYTELFEETKSHKYIYCKELCSGQVDNLILLLSETVQAIPDEYFDSFPLRVTSYISNFIDSKPFLPPKREMELHYTKGLSFIRQNYFCNALKELQEFYQYCKDKPQFKYNYRFLNCKYLILFLQLHSHLIPDKEFVASLILAFDELPSPQKDSKRYIQLKDDFYSLINNSENMNDIY